MSPCHLNLLSELAFPVILKRLEQHKGKKLKCFLSLRRKKRATFLNLQEKNYRICGDY